MVPAILFGLQNGRHPISRSPIRHAFRTTLMIANADAIKAIHDCDRGKQPQLHTSRSSGTGCFIHIDLKHEYKQREVDMRSRRSRESISYLETGRIKASREINTKPCNIKFMAAIHTSHSLEESHQVVAYPELKVLMCLDENSWRFSYSQLNTISLARDNNNKIPTRYATQQHNRILGIVHDSMTSPPSKVPTVHMCYDFRQRRTRIIAMHVSPWPYN
jgi:hypothetical protein